MHPPLSSNVVGWEIHERYLGVSKLEHHLVYLSMFSMFDYGKVHCKPFWDQTCFLFGIPWSFSSTKMWLFFASRSVKRDWMIQHRRNWSTISGEYISYTIIMYEWYNHISMNICRYICISTCIDMYVQICIYKSMNINI